MKGLFPDPLKIKKQIKNDRKCFQAEGRETLVGKCNSSEERGWQTRPEINEVLSNLPTLGAAIMWNIGVSKKKGGRCWHLLVCCGEPEAASPQELQPRWDSAGAEPWGNGLGRKGKGEKHDTARGVFQHPNVLQTPHGPPSLTQKRKPR